MVEFLTVANLQTFEPSIDSAKAQEMIDDATALAVLTAPCLTDLDPSEDAGKIAAVKAVLRGAILRWNDSGSGAVTQQTAGPFGQSIDTRGQRQSMFWPSEITQLQNICAGGDAADAFMIDTAPRGSGLIHADICAVNFGALYCSCGAILTHNLPLYENL